MERFTHRIRVPGSVAAAGLFGGALVLASLGVAAILGLTSIGAFVEAASTTPAIPPVVLADLELAALGVVLVSGIVLVRRLRTSTAALNRSARDAEQSANEAAESARRLQVLVDHVPAAVYIDMADPDVTDGGRLAYMSPQITGILGFLPEAFVDDPELWPSRIHPDDRAATILAYAAHWRTGEPLRCEYRMLAHDGTEVWIRDEAFAMADDTRSGMRVSQGLLVDITDRKRLESKLIHDALHDPLTGLANRVLLRDHLERALARQGRAPGRVALLFVDLDDFKRVNDSYGHAVGDQILCRVADRLVASVRGSDVVGRQSGDEFAIVLDHVVADEEATAAAERILRELRRPIQLGGRVIVVGGSIGVAISGHATAVEDLLLHADAAMYAAKRDGKGTFAIYDARMPVRTWTELEAAG